MAKDPRRPTTLEGSPDGWVERVGERVQGDEARASTAAERAARPRHNAAAEGYPTVSAVPHEIAFDDETNPNASELDQINHRTKRHTAGIGDALARLETLTEVALAREARESQLARAQLDASTQIRLARGAFIIKLAKALGAILLGIVTAILAYYAGKHGG